VNFSVHLPHTVHLLSLASVNGSISGHFDKKNWPDQLNIRTISGHIELQLPGDLNTNLELQIPGRHFHSDFTVSAVRAQRAGRVSGTIGKGGGSLKISTVSGYVTLRRDSLRSAAAIVQTPAKRETTHDSGAFLIKEGFSNDTCGERLAQAGSGC